MMPILSLFGRCIATAVVTYTLGWIGYAEYTFLSDYFSRQTVVKTIKASPTVERDIDPPVEVVTYTYTSTPPEPAIVQTDEDTDAFYVGEYYLLEDGRPKAFRDIEYISIETHEFADTDSLDPWSPITPKGLLRTDREYKFTKIAVSKRFLTFETEAHNGISYSFNGRPVDYGPNHDPNNVGDITGKFSKLKDGKVVATFDAVLYMEGC